MPQYIGSLSWARETGGRLSWRDKIGMMTRIVRLQIATTLAQWRHPQPAPFDLAAVRVPDSPLAKEAVALCEEVSPPSIALHCMRAYYWGSILGQQAKLTYDEELFFVIAQLHDLGLTPPYQGKYTDAHCFAVEGGRAAQTFCMAHGWEEDRASRVHEAIARHLNIDVPLSDGAEAHLIRAGSGLDVIGVRRWEIHRGTRQAVLTRFPRDGMVVDMQAAMAKEIAQRPDSRVAFLFQAAGFKGRMAGAKLD